MNAVAFFLEIIGSLFALLLGRSLFLFFFEIIYAFLVAYVLYWLVICAVPASGAGNDYQMVAIGLFVIYSIINTIQAVTTLGLILPALFFFCKTVCANAAWIGAEAAFASHRVCTTTGVSSLFSHACPLARIRLCAPSRHRSPHLRARTTSSKSRRASAARLSSRTRRRPSSCPTRLPSKVTSSMTAPTTSMWVGREAALPWRRL